MSLQLTPDEVHALFVSLSGGALRIDVHALSSSCLSLGLNDITREQLAEMLMLFSSTSRGNSLTEEDFMKLVAEAKL